MMLWVLAAILVALLVVLWIWRGRWLLVAFLERAVENDER